ncbi:MAG: hypothetical protein AB7I18_01900 [Candidatus Berkiella sp.]
MQEIKDLAQLNIISGGNQDCHFIDDWECQYLYAATSVLFTSPFLLMATSWSAAVMGAMAGVGLSYVFYRNFSGYILPECGVPAGYTTYNQSCKS